MATTIVFDLISALVDRFTVILSPTLVLDGQGATDDPGNFLMVGVPDPNSDEAANSAEGTLAWAGLGHRTSKEEATITCCALAWSGDSGNAAQRAVRETVRDISSAVEADLRNDPNLGGVVPGLNWVRYAGPAGDAGGRWSLEQLSASDGVACLFKFDIAYFASLSA